MLPGGIQTEHWPDRAIYDLPMRPIGWLHWFGLLPIGFAVLFASVPVTIGWHFMSQLANGQGEAFNWAILAFLSLFIIAALMPFGLGLLILAGRTRLVVTRDRLIVTEIAGPVRRRRKVRLQDIERLELAGGSGERTTASVPAFLNGLGGLGATLKSGKKMLLLLGYPRDWLEPLANELSGLMQRLGAPVPVESIEPTLQSCSTDSVEEMVEKPASSMVKVEPASNGVRFEIPPAGLRRGTKGMLKFAIIWCLFMLIFTAAWLKSEKHVPLGVCLFIAAFWLIGLGMLAGALNLGRRRATLVAENGGLRVEQKGPFGARTWQWRRGEIAALRADASGMKVNDVPVIQLQVHLATGKKLGFLSGRDETELRWLASELRRALGVPAQQTLDQTARRT